MWNSFRKIVAMNFAMLWFAGLCNETSIPVPSEMKLMVASFGTINSQAEIEGWLSDQLKPLNNLTSAPELAAGDYAVNPQSPIEMAYVNWKDKCVRYYRGSEEVAAENARRARILTGLKTHMLSDAAQRYTQLGRDYLQSKLYRKCGRLIAVVDRGNMTIQQTEKQLKEDFTDRISTADCIVSVVFGDRETSSKTIPIDNSGTEIKRIVYRQPFVGKVRDLAGNVLLSFDDVAEFKLSQDNVVAVTNSDPARKLVELACEKIADQIVNYFTIELKFKIKVPTGMDPEDVEICLDGMILGETSVRVLACNHRFRAELAGCATIEKTFVCNPSRTTQTVKLNFKKN